MCLTPHVCKIPLGALYMTKKWFGYDCDASDSIAWWILRSSLFFPFLFFFSSSKFFFSFLSNFLARFIKYRKNNRDYTLYALWLGSIHIMFRYLIIVMLIKMACSQVCLPEKTKMIFFFSSKNHFDRSHWFLFPLYLRWLANGISLTFYAFCHCIQSFQSFKIEIFNHCVFLNAYREKKKLN